MSSYLNSVISNSGSLRASRFLSVISTAIILTAMISAINGQEHKPDTGAKLGSAYSVGEFDTVNTTNGNLMLNFPLGSTPKGRGQAAAGIGLYYNSKLYSTRVTKYLDERYPCDWADEGPESCTYYYKTTIEQNPTGGWRYGWQYSLQVENRLNSMNYGLPSCRTLGSPNSSWEEQTYIHKLRIVFPDGSTHEMLPYGYSDSSALQDKFYRVRFDGVIENCGGSQTRTGSAMTYYSDDGSYLRLAFSYDGDVDGNNNTWTLYFPDGSRVTSAQTVYDRNGNSVTGLTDPFGRGVSMTTDGSGDHFTVDGVGGADVTWTVTWKTIYVNKTYRSCASTCPSSEWRTTLGELFSVVDTISEPSQMGGRTYVFSYNGHPYPNPPGESNGWGEVSQVLLPTRTAETTDARIDYAYDMDGVDGADDELPSDIDRIMDNFPTSKTLLHDGESDVWNYGTGGTQGGTVEPDGGSTINYFFNTHPSVAGWKDGLTYKTEYPNGTKVEKVWAKNAPQSACDTIYGFQFSCNPYVKAEYTSIKSGSTYTYTSAKQYTYDKNGNVTEVDEYDWIPYSTINRTSGMPDDTQSGISSYLKRKTLSTYYNDTPTASSTTYSDADSYWLSSSKRLLHLPKSVEVQDASSTPKSRSEMTYDYTDYVSANTVGGNVTLTKSWDSFKGGSSQSYSNPLTSTNSISTSATYNSYGMPTQTTDANSVQTTITYGSISGYSPLYPTQIEVASNYAPVKRTSTAAYDFYTGVVTTATDVDNSLSTATVYDDIGRPTIVKSAYGSGLESWTQSTYNDTSRYVVVKSDLTALTDAKNVATTFFDQLGRPRLSKTLEDASSQSATNETDGIKVETKYKISSGYTYRLTSNPYRTTSDSTMGWTRTKTGSTGLHSDVETFSGSTLPGPWSSNTTSTGVVQTDIDANTTTVTDQASKVRRSLVNGLGQMTRVDEPTTGGLGTVSSPNQNTDYVYDVLNNLLTVGQGSQTRTFTYSSLSRLRSANNPESGTVTYAYDNNGNLTNRADARSVSTTYTYDALNRPTQRSYSDGTPVVNFYYDSQTLPSGAPSYTHGTTAGRLLAITYGTSSSEGTYRAYDLLGRVTQQYQRTDGVNYQIDASYNLAGMMTGETYPGDGINRRSQTNTLDAIGRTSSLSSTSSASPTGSASVSSVSYAPHGALASQTLGNGLAHAIGYNPRLQPTSIQLGSSGSVMSLSYTYGTSTANNGNISQIAYSGGGTSFTQAFTYDELNRLSTSQENSGSSWTQTNGYDRYGNRSITAGVGSGSAPTFSSSTNRITTSGFTYDSAGNVTADGSHTYTFDGENKVLALDGTLNYRYDGEGKRVRKLNTEKTRYIYGIGGELLAEYDGTNSGVRGSILKEYIYGASGLTATIDSTNGTAYLTSDHLGSPRVITNSGATVTSRRDFMPFGEEVSTGAGRSAPQGWPGITVRQKFTGYERDGENGLDYAEARNYLSSIGRFFSADPLMASANAVDPQSWNRYVYVQNNPIITIDPTGMAPTDFINEETGTRSRIEDGKDQVIVASTSQIETLSSENTKQGGAYLRDLAALEDSDRNLHLTGSEFEARVATTYGESSAFRKDVSNEELGNEMKAIAYVNQRNNTTYGQGSPQADDYRNTLLSKETDKMKLANLAIANQVRGGPDPSNGATGWDGREQALFADNDKRASVGSWSLRKNTGGWSISDADYAKWKQNVGTAFKAPQYSTASSGRNKGQVRYYSTAVYGNTIFWRIQ